MRKEGPLPANSIIQLFYILKKRRKEILLNKLLAPQVSPFGKGIHPWFPCDNNDCRHWKWKLVCLCIIALATIIIWRLIFHHQSSGPGLLLVLLLFPQSTMQSWRMPKIMLNLSNFLLRDQRSPKKSIRFFLTPISLSELILHDPWVLKRTTKNMPDLMSNSRPKICSKFSKIFEDELVKLPRAYQLRHDVIVHSVERWPPWFSQN